MLTNLPSLDPQNSIRISLGFRLVLPKNSNSAQRVRQILWFRFDSILMHIFIQFFATFDSSIILYFFYKFFEPRIGTLDGGEEW